MDVVGNGYMSFKLDRHSIGQYDILAKPLEPEDVVGHNVTFNGTIVGEIVSAKVDKGSLNVTAKTAMGLSIEEHWPHFQIVIDPTLDVGEWRVA